MYRFAVPALLRTSSWPMISFVVFTAPPEGRTDVFRRGDPFMQMIFVLAEPEFEQAAMTEAEAAERKLLDRRIHDSRETLVKDSTWTSSTRTVFDGTYRNIFRAARAKAKAMRPAHREPAPRDTAQTSQDVDAAWTEHQGTMLLVGAVEIQDGGTGPDRIRLQQVPD